MRKPRKIKTLMPHWTQHKQKHGHRLLPQGLRSISDLQAGEHGIIGFIRGGEEFNRRMLTLGFTPGTEITVIQNFRWGPILVMVRDMRVALGRGEALKILVEAK